MPLHCQEQAWTAFEAGLCYPCDRQRALLLSLTDLAWVVVLSKRLLQASGYLKYGEFVRHNPRGFRHSRRLTGEHRPGRNAKPSVQMAKSATARLPLAGSTRRIFCLQTGQLATRRRVSTAGYKSRNLPNFNFHNWTTAVVWRMRRALRGQHCYGVLHAALACCLFPLFWPRPGPVPSGLNVSILHNFCCDRLHIPALHGCHP